MTLVMNLLPFLQIGKAGGLRNAFKFPKGGAARITEAYNEGKVASPKWGEFNKTSKKNADIRESENTLNSANERKLVVNTPSNQGDVLPAKILREVKKGEKISDLVDEAKYLTRQEGQEHALIKLNGKRYLVSGGRDGIELPHNTEIIYGHTHPNLPGTRPFNNGPSTGDREALNFMNNGKGQSKQYVFHDGQRTTIYRGKGSEFDVSITNY
ncbi:MAG: hypothetical protein HYZ42_16410 [Bacteroidetes bacterium]|nr:hypothetical protein [Bacteroidota bacterium]